jgi:hypothetical protein
MIIERTKNEVIFRLPANTNIDDLQDISDLFEFRELSNKSKATQADVDALVKTIKKGRWAKTKARLSE